MRTNIEARIKRLETERGPEGLVVIYGRSEEDFHRQIEELKKLGQITDRTPIVAIRRFSNVGIVKPVG